MKILIATCMFILTISSTHVSFGMRSMADQPLTSTPTVAPVLTRKQKIQQSSTRRYQRTPQTSPEQHVAIRTPAGLLPIDTPLATIPDLEHDTHMIKPHIGKVVPRDYAHWSFE